MIPIILFGGTGKAQQFGGELTKNKELILRLQCLGYKVKVFDCYYCRTNIYKLIKLVLTFFLYTIFHPKSTIIFSSAFNNIRPFLEILNNLHIKNRIVYWVIGGVFSQRVLKGELNQKLLESIDLFIVEGNKMKLEMIDAGFSNVIVIPNFKTIGKIYRKEERLNDQEKKFLFLSRIMPEKGVDYIFQAIERLNALGLSEKFKVDFYGTVELKYQKEFFMKIDSLPNVSYCGKINLFEEKGYEHLSHYHFMLFPTFWVGEGFPGVVIDAYKAGVPIIASDWNFNKEFIENKKTGVIIPVHSSEALIIAMKDAIEMSPTDFENLIDNCHRRIHDFDTINVLTEKIVCQIIQGSR